MQLPIILRDAIEEELASVKPEALAKAAAELSDAYRAGGGRGRAPISTEAHARAYLATRMPATFAAVCAVFAEIQKRMPDTPLTSLLDLGAGPGTAMWAVAEVFDRLEKITLVERDRNFISLGRRLAQASTDGAVRSAQWVATNLESAFDIAPHDVVVLSYSLGEFKPQAQASLIERAWQAAGKILVVIEPGTTTGYGNVIRARSQLLDAGASVIAPCPHAAPCPLEGVDWCHFAARVERTSLHRRAKGGTSAYEDEKFSYFVGAKLETVTPAAARILRHPMILKGHIRLELCTTDGLHRETVTRSHKDAFRRARKAEWGDAWQSGDE